jgi:hypothetical protein
MKQYTCHLTYIYIHIHTYTYTETKQSACHQWRKAHVGAAAAVNFTSYMQHETATVAYTTAYFHVVATRDRSCTLLQHETATVAVGR